MLSLPDGVSKGVMFLWLSVRCVCLFVCPFIRTDLVTKISHERLERIFISPYC